jgi:hypothetical protein
MKAILKLSFLLLALPLCAQKNQITIGPVADINPTVELQVNPANTYAGLVTSSYKDAAGGFIDYTRWLTSHQGLTLHYEQNPSGGLLVGVGFGGPAGTSPANAIYRFSLMRYEFSALADQCMPLKGKWTGCVREGIGAVLLAENDSGAGKAGVSHDWAIYSGGYFDYQLSKHYSAGVGVLIVASEPGCYNDPLCRSQLGFGPDPYLEASYHW